MHSNHVAAAPYQILQPHLVSRMCVCVCVCVCVWCVCVCVCVCGVCVCVCVWCVIACVHACVMSLCAVRVPKFKLFQDPTVNNVAVL